MHMHLSSKLHCDDGQPQHMQYFKCIIFNFTTISIFLVIRPGPDMKKAMASSIIAEFPFLKDPAGNGDVSLQISFTDFGVKSLSKVHPKFK